MINSNNGDIIRFINRDKFEITMKDVPSNFVVYIKKSIPNGKIKNLSDVDIELIRCEEDIRYYLTNKFDRKSIDLFKIISSIDTYGISVINKKKEFQISVN